MTRQEKRLFATRAIALTLLSIISSVSFPQATADAQWRDTSYTKSTFTALVVNPPTKLTCTAGILMPVTFRWTAPPAPTTLNSGAPMTGYRWTLKNAGGATIDTGLLASSATSKSFLGDGAISLGVTYYFSLVALGPSPWRSTPVIGTATFTTVIVIGILSACTVT
ncbi:MAG: hypothetical protein ACJAS7_001146 [Alpinimonas sp.]